MPIIVLGSAGTAYLIRTMRAAVLDELNQMYVMAARAGGLSPLHLLFKYPVRMALNPILATLGWRLTYVISGAPDRKSTRLNSITSLSRMPSSA